MAALLALITSESSTTALILSLKTAGASTALCLLLGVPMALVLARDGRSAVLITHDLLDVLTLADRVLVLETGQIVETGSTATVLAIPRSRFGARFAGVNLVGGTAHADGVLTTQWGRPGMAAPARRSGRRVGGGAVQPIGGRRVPRQTARQPSQHRRGDGRRTRQSRSRDPVRADEQPDGAPGLAADITADSAAELRLAPGDRVYFSVKAQEVTVHLSP